jgi:hypothetical protein
MGTWMAGKFLATVRGTRIERYAFLSAKKGR